MVGLEAQATKAPWIEDREGIHISRPVGELRVLIFYDETYEYDARFYQNSSKSFIGT